MSERNMIGALICIAALGGGVPIAGYDREPGPYRRAPKRFIPYVAPVKNGKRKQRRDRGKRKEVSNAPD